MAAPDNPRRLAVGAAAIGLGLAVSLAIGALGWVYAADLVTLMGATPGMLDSSVGYARVMLTGNATVTLLFLTKAIFRGAGDAAMAMRMLMVSNGINIVLDPCFIFGWGPFPEMGVTGAAVATNIGVVRRSRAADGAIRSLATSWPSLSDGST